MRLRAVGFAARRARAEFRVAALRFDAGGKMRRLRRGVGAFARVHATVPLRQCARIMARAPHGMRRDAARADGHLERSRYQTGIPRTDPMWILLARKTVCSGRRSATRATRRG